MSSSLRPEGTSGPYAAPPLSQFPDHPASWYLWGKSQDLGRGPITRTLFGKRMVAWRVSSGLPVVLSAQCSHFGADLGQGRVVGDRLQCAFHHWEYAADGRCAHIPATKRIPPTACQTPWPVTERHGLIFVFNGAEPRFELPFFNGCNPHEFSPARAIKALVECPWHLIGANAFDVQHFRAAHDRRLVGEPAVSQPHPLARHAEGTFDVAGDNWRDHVTRRFAGDRVTMAITDWCGNLMLATATFRRTTSYGMVITEPQGPNRVLVRIFVFLPRSKTTWGRALADPFRREVRRYFIMKFLSEDAKRLQGAAYKPNGFIESDCHLVDYFRWLAAAAWPERDVPGVSAKSAVRQRRVDCAEPSS
jgi:phenylpropionate dioxygenase-like ring-hydroxylating dioxygenase large terminal subunit